MSGSLLDVRGRFRIRDDELGRWERSSRSKTWRVWAWGPSPQRYGLRPARDELGPSWPPSSRCLQPGQRGKADEMGSGFQSGSRAGQALSPGALASRKLQPGSWQLIHAVRYWLLPALNSQGLRGSWALAVAFHTLSGHPGQAPGEWWFQHYWSWGQFPGPFWARRG